MAPSQSDDPSGAGPVVARIVPGLFRSRNFIWASDHRIVEAQGLTWTQFVTLISLQAAGPDHTLSPTALYKAVQASSSGMAKMLQGLAEAGYIERLENPEDGRSRLARLTERGDAKAKSISAELIATNSELIGGILTAEESHTLAALLQKLSAGLQKKKA